MLKTMTNKLKEENLNNTEIIFVLDRSGSMSTMKAEAIGGFNSFLEEQKKLPGKAKMTLVLFDNEYLVIHKNKNLTKIEPLNTDTYVPRGMTALVDAVGRSVSEAKARITKMAKSRRPDGVVVAILTDGMENASQEYSSSQLAELVNECKDKGWGFVYLGANQDSFAEAQKLGINNAINFAPTADGIHTAYINSSNLVRGYRSSGKIDMNMVNNKK